MMMETTATSLKRDRMSLSVNVHSRMFVTHIGYKARQNVTPMMYHIVPFTFVYEP